MDPICHTLIGAVLGQTGLERKTRYSRVTLIIAANLPDIDVVAHAMGDTASYAFRRGITHGIPALVVLPFLLAAAVWAFGRRRPPASTGPPLSFQGLLLLSVIGVVSHPVLDWMNTYGMRWLMPIVDRWYYGDTLFIIDWIAWAILGGGLLAALRISSEHIAWFRRPACISLVTFSAYIAMNYAFTQSAERAALVALAEDLPVRLLASPVPFDPLRREIVLEYPEEYRFADYRAFTGFAQRQRVVDRGDPQHLAVARTSLDGRRFLHWARFPYSLITTRDGSPKLVIADARYVPDIENPRLDGFAVLTLDAPTD